MNFGPKGEWDSVVNMPDFVKRVHSLNLIFDEKLYDITPGAINVITTCSS